MEVCVHIALCYISSNVVDSGARGFTFVFKPVGAFIVSVSSFAWACDEHCHGGVTVARSVVQWLAWRILLYQG
ncbi:hypothetical protein DEO72_LG5g1948 [Vigna unguiculata]|uniref:Uncharacterized protein n=1 Tax=Vigna unguiculata TaxID=3917 RepID=A0A4D6LYA3_VIGUN|nr:hypothetical protein DEO72_LG5g1948 [Vigna unguiculata]